MARRSRRGPKGGAGGHLSLAAAAAELGMEASELAELIREAGAAPPGPEAEWVLEAADLEALARERSRQEERNLRELRKLLDDESEG